MILSQDQPFNLSILTSYEIQQLRLLEAWCAFGHNEFGKNVISVLEIITHKIHGKDATITSGLLKRFDMDAQDIKAYVSRRSNKVLLGPPYCFYH